MARTFTITATLALLCLAVALPAGQAVAQQKQQVSIKAAPENSKYMQQQQVDVGDAPNHVVRVFDVHHTYPGNAPVINGLKLVEGSDRGIADLTAGNGNATLYSVYTMENGDKLFTRTTNVVQTAGGKLTATQVGTITGGTGKLAGIQGVVRATTNFDPKTGFNENQTDIEYTIGK